MFKVSVAFVAFGAVLAFWSCSDDSAGVVQVDGLYNATIDPADGGDQPKDGLVDVLWRDDGTVDISYISSDIPWPRLVEAVELQPGNLVKWEDNAGNWIEGRILSDRFELRGNNQRREGRGEPPIGVTGEARPLTDADDLDGHYSLSVVTYERDTTKVVEERLNVGSLRRTADGQYLVGAYEFCAFYLPPFAKGERFDWRGDAYIYSSFWGWFRVDGRVYGRLDTIGLDLVLEVREVDPADQLEHVYRFDLAGDKRRPSTANLTNDWRVEIEYHEGCLVAQPFDNVQWFTLRTTELSNGDLVFGDSDVTGVVLSARGPSIWKFTDGSPELGYTNDLTINALPPKLTYALTFRMYDESGAVICEDSYKSLQAAPRYVF